MNTNEIKQKLHSYKYIEFKIDAINEDLINLAAVIDTQRNVKCPIITGMPGSNNISDPVGDAAERIIDKYCHEYARCENELDRLFKEKNQIDDLLEILNSTERRIIELKFFIKYKWWMVADTMNYSEKQCRRISNNAITKIRDKANKP